NRLATAATMPGRSSQLNFKISSSTFSDTFFVPTLYFTIDVGRVSNGPTLRAPPADLCQAHGGWRFAYPPYALEHFGYILKKFRLPTPKVNGGAHCETFKSRTT